MGQEIITGDKKTYAIPQGVGIITYAFDEILLKPALFSCLTTATGNINVVYWDDSTEIIAAQELNLRNMLIKQIKTASTTTLLATIRLEV